MEWIRLVNEHKCNRWKWIGENVMVYVWWNMRNEWLVVDIVNVKYPYDYVANMMVLREVWLCIYLGGLV